MDTVREFDINACSPDIIKGTGSHYTPSDLADFVAEHILLNFDLDKHQNIKILDPAIGDGELMIALLKKIYATHKGQIKVYGFDTNTTAIKNTNATIKKLFPKVSLNLEVGDFLEATNKIANQIDIVISNPPYVRTQVMGADKAQNLAKQYGLEGRVDLYYTFFPAIAEVLKATGILGIITSNRFMTTRSGESVRELLINNYNIHEVWDFGDTKLFNAAVLPCVLIMSRGASTSSEDITFSSSYSCTLNDIPKTKIKNLNELFSKNEYVLFKNETFKINSGFLEIHENHRDVWKISNEKSKIFLDTVSKNTALTFQEIGKVRVGVKTTADKVFIKTKSEWENEKVEKNALKELTTHHIARRWYPNIKKRTKQILYTHMLNDKNQTQVIDFDAFPNAKKYLHSNKERLSSRKYVLEAGRKWFEIWVPQNPNAWPKEKVVFRDIAEAPTFWFDKDGSIINGDCYWFTNDSKYSNEILWLALAIANSDFIIKFYEYKFNNKLYSGRCRFMTQYVNQFPLPNPTSDISKEIITLAKNAYKKVSKGSDVGELELKINKLVWKAFDLSNYQ